MCRKCVGNVGNDFCVQSLLLFAANSTSMREDLFMGDNASGFYFDRETLYFRKIIVDRRISKHKSSLCLFPGPLLKLC